MCHDKAGRHFRFRCLRVGLPSETWTMTGLLTLPSTVTTARPLFSAMKAGTEITGCRSGLLARRATEMELAPGSAWYRRADLNSTHSQAAPEVTCPRATKERISASAQRKKLGCLKSRGPVAWYSVWIRFPATELFSLSRGRN